MRKILCLLSFVVFCNFSDIGTKDNSAEAIKFIQKLERSYLVFLQNDKLKLSDRYEKFLEALDSHFAVKSIAGFTLGRYRRLFDADARERFYKIFRNMLAIIYVDKFLYFGKISLFDFVAIKKENDKVEEYAVSCKVKTKNNSEVSLKWGIIKSSDGFKIVDVAVDGISMNVTQRDEFMSQISKIGDNVNIFLSSLEKRYGNLYNREGI